MRIWRLLLVLLLSVAIPTFGFGAANVDDDCAMRTDGGGAAAMRTDGGGAAAMAAMQEGACCDEPDGSERPSNEACAMHCTVAGDCRSIPYVQPFAGSVPLVTYGTQLRRDTSAHIVASDPSGVWRPPRLL